MLHEHRALVVWLDLSWRTDLKGHPDDKQAVDCHRLVSWDNSSFPEEEPSPTKPQALSCLGIAMALR